MGNTDIHGVYNQTYRTDRQYGPMTIVFARERSIEGIKEALFAHRSVVKFGDMLIGSENNLKSTHESLSLLQNKASERK